MLSSVHLVMLSLSTTFLLLGALAVGRAAKTPYPLPSYLKRACSRNDPKINECMVEVGGPAIKLVAKGDPKYKIPRLDPLLLKEIRINQGTKQVGLRLFIKDCLMWGLQDTKFVKAKVDWKKRTCLWDFELDKMKINGKYNVTGQVLLLPVFGSGDCEIWLDTMKFSYFYTWDYEKKNGFTYVKIRNSTFPLEIGHMKMSFDNLFNGDRLLSTNMNMFINDNWKEILKDLKPTLSETLATLTSSVLGNMAAVVPYDYMFPDI